MIILNNKIELDAFASKNSQPFDDVSSHDIFNDDGLPLSSSHGFLFFLGSVLICPAPHPNVGAGRPAPRWVRGGADESQAATGIGRGM